MFYNYTEMLFIESLILHKHCFQLVMWSALYDFTKNFTDFSYWNKGDFISHTVTKNFFFNLRIYIELIYI